MRDKKFSLNMFSPDLTTVRDAIQKRPIIRDTITATFFNIVGKGIGFLIPLCISWFFGVSRETDAFFFAYGIVLFLTNIAAISMESISVPFIAGIRAREDGRVGAFVVGLIFWSALSLLLVAALFIGFAKPGLRLLTSFQGGALDFLFILLLEIIPLLILITVTNILSGAFNAYKIFWLPAVSPAFRAVVTLVVIVLFKNKYGIHAVAIGYTAGELFRLFMYFVALVKMNLFKLSFGGIRDAELIHFYKTAFFQMLSLLAVGMNPIVDKTMASWLGVGSISTLEYADRLYAMVLTLLSSGFLTVVLSHLSGNVAEQGDLKLMRSVQQLGKRIFAFSIGISILFILASSLITKLAYVHGSFPVALIPRVNNLFICLILGVAPYMASQVVIRGLLAIKATKIIMWLAIWKNFLNIGLNFMFIRYFDLYGIAISTSVTSLCMLLIALKYFRTEIDARIALRPAELVMDSVVK